MVEHSTYNSEIEVLDPATDTGRHKFDIISLADYWLCPENTVVEQSTYNPEIEGSDPATGTGRHKFET